MVVVIQDVYNFLHVSEIEFEDDEGDPDFELLQPMPKKVFAKSEMTLEEAGLHPKAILQVKEIWEINCLAFIIN